MRRQASRPSPTRPAEHPWPGHPWVAAVTLDRRLAATALARYLVFALPHVLFHLQHLEPFGAVDAAAQVVTLAAAAVLPVPLLALARRSHPRPPAPVGSRDRNHPTRNATSG